MVFAQKILVSFNCWWKCMGLGTAKNGKRPEAGVSVAGSQASLTKAVVLSDA